MAAIKAVWSESGSREPGGDISNAGVLCTALRSPAAEIDAGIDAVRFGGLLSLRLHLLRHGVLVVSLPGLDPGLLCRIDDDRCRWRWVSLCGGFGRGGGLAGRWRLFAGDCDDALGV